MKRIEKQLVAIMAAVAVSGAVLALATLVLCAGSDEIRTDGCGGDGAGFSGTACTDTTVPGTARVSTEIAQETAVTSLPGDGLLECGAPVSGAVVSLPPVCAEEGVLESTARTGLGVRATWEVDVGLAEAAEGIVEFYRDAGGFTLAYDGYLDLMGCVWGCVVQSDDDWVEVAIVDERGLDGDAIEEGDGLRSCSVTVVRFGES